MDFYFELSVLDIVIVAFEGVAFVFQQVVYWFLFRNRQEWVVVPQINWGVSVFHGIAGQKIVTVFAQVLVHYQPVPVLTLNFKFFIFDWLLLDQLRNLIVLCPIEVELNLTINMVGYNFERIGSHPMEHEELDLALLQLQVSNFSPLKMSYMCRGWTYWYWVSTALYCLHSDEVCFVLSILQHQLIPVLCS